MLIKNQALTTAFVLFAMIVAAPVVVYAQSDEASRDIKAVEETRKEYSERAEARKAAAEDRRESAKRRVEQLKDRAKERRIQIREKVCERKQDKIEKLIPRLEERADRFKTKADTVYERVQNFVSDKELSIDNYELLTTSVDSAQAEAGVSVQTLKEYDIDFACDKEGMAEQLEGYRLAVSEAKESLKNYRQSLVELIKSLRNEVKAIKEAR